MTVFIQIDLMARGASIALFMLWSWLLWRDHRVILAARLGIAMNASIIGYLLATGPWNLDRSVSGFLLSLVGGATPGLFWLFARSWFNDRQRLDRWAVAFILVSVVNITAMQWSFLHYPPLNLVTGTIFRLAMLGFACAGLWEAWRGRDGDLVETRRYLRPRIVAAVGIYVILIAFVEIAVYNYAAPLWIARSVGSSIAVITFLFVLLCSGCGNRIFLVSRQRLQPTTLFNLSIIS